MCELPSSVDKSELQLNNLLLKMVKVPLLAVVLPKTELVLCLSFWLYEYAPMTNEMPPPKVFAPKTVLPNEQIALQFDSVLLDMV